MRAKGSKRRPACLPAFTNQPTDTFNFHQVPNPGFAYPVDTAPNFARRLEGHLGQAKKKPTLKILVRFPCSGAAGAADSWEIEAKNG